MQPKTLGQLAELVGGKVVGDPEISIRSAATLDQAGEGDISFLGNRKYANQLKTTKASAVIVKEENIDTQASMLVTDDPYYAFMQTMVCLYGHRKHPQNGISEKACIAENAQIGQDCHINAFAVVDKGAKIGDRCVLYPGVYVGMGTEIGDDCVLYANAAVYDKCSIGNSVIIHANSVIGQDGFGFATKNGKHNKIPHIGRVIIEDEVEIGANSAIERGTLEDTIIGAGSKLGDSVVIGHGTKIGPGCLFVPQVGIAGSTTIGHHCVFGGQCGVVGHIKIGNMVQVAAQAAVINDVPDGSMLVGAPAIEASKAKRAYSLIETLPDMRKQLKDVTKRLKKIEE